MGGTILGATSSYWCWLLNQIYDQQSLSYPHKLTPNYEEVRGVRILDIEGSNLKKMCQAVIYFCQSIKIQGKINPINNIIGSLSIRNYWQGQSPSMRNNGTVPVNNHYYPVWVGFGVEIIRPMETQFGRTSLLELSLATFYLTTLTCLLDGFKLYHYYSGWVRWAVGVGIIRLTAYLVRLIIRLTDSLYTLTTWRLYTECTTTTS